MKDRRQALRLFERIADYNYPVAFERQPSTKKEASDYLVCVETKGLGATEITRVAQLAKDEEVDCNITAHGKRTFMVLS